MRPIVATPPLLSTLMAKFIGHSAVPLAAVRVGDEALDGIKPVRSATAAVFVSAGPQLMRAGVMEIPGLAAVRVTCKIPLPAFVIDIVLVAVEPTGTRPKSMDV